MKKSDGINPQEAPQAWHKQIFGKEGMAMQICQYTSPTMPEYTLQMTRWGKNRVFGAYVKTENSDVSDKFIQSLSEIPQCTYEETAWYGYKVSEKNMENDFIPTVEAMIRVVDCFSSIPEQTKAKMAKDFEGLQYIYQPLPLKELVANFIAKNEGKYATEVLKTLPTDLCELLDGITESMSSRVQKIMEERKPKQSNQENYSKAYSESQGRGI